MRAFILYALFLVSSVLRCLAGGSYLPILDDSIQLISYPNAPDPWGVVMREGLLSSRPLAGLSDIYFTGRLPNFTLAVILYSALFAASGILFYRLFQRYFHTGAAFCIVYALLPLGVEGSYWLSASTRLAPGLLLTAAAALVLDDFINRGGWWRAALFAPLSLVSFCFYEQILVLSLTLSGLQFLAYVRYERRAWGAVIALGMAGVYAAFTAAFASDSALGSRMALAFPTTASYYFSTFLPDVARQIGTAFLKGGWQTLALGFWRGITENTTAWHWIYLILSLGAGVVLYFLLRPEKKRMVTPLRPLALTIVWGILLALAPITPFFIIQNPWFSLRSCVPSFVGAALLIDLGARALFRQKQAFALFCSALMAVCLIASGTEVRDFRAAAEADETIAREILAHESEMAGRVGILSLEEFMSEKQSFAYHEHAASAMASEWGLYGKLVAVAKRELAIAPVPLAVTGFSYYHGWNTDMKRVDGFDQMWAWEDGALLPLTIRMTGEHDAELYRADTGALYARIWEESDGYGYIAITD